MDDNNEDPNVGKDVESNSLPRGILKKDKTTDSQSGRCAKFPTIPEDRSFEDPPDLRPEPVAVIAFHLINKQKYRIF